MNLIVCFIMLLGLYVCLKFFSLSLVSKSHYVKVLLGLNISVLLNTGFSKLLGIELGHNLITKAIR